MKSSFGLAVATAVMMTAASPALGHWQFTKWGMTPEHVVAASGGSAEIGSGERSSQGDAVKGAVGRYQSGEYQFYASYWFVGGALSKVTLSSRTDAQCRSVQRDLLAKYGSPVEDSGGMVQRQMWVDKPSGNRIAIILAGFGYCELQYSPLNDASSAWL